jgi:hypothetical protein
MASKPLQPALHPAGARIKPTRGHSTLQPTIERVIAECMDKQEILQTPFRISACSAGLDGNKAIL